MSQDNQFTQNPDYYAARAVEERRLAMSSNDERVRAIHLELASKYAELAAMGAPQPSSAIVDRQRTG